MRFLIASAQLPYFDRTSGGLRLFTLLRLLCEAGHDIDYLVTIPAVEQRALGEDEYSRYRDKLAELGILLREMPFRRLIRENRYDTVLFEWFHAAEPFLHQLRLWQPQAKAVVDSVDLTYRRWHAKADLSGRTEDRSHAKKVERRELEIYRRAEVVLTLTDDEKEELETRIPGIRTFVVPNIHHVSDTERVEGSLPELLFIGSFSHEPNVDAVRFFGKEIWPGLKQALPDLRCTVIGQQPPTDVQALSKVGMSIMGRVPETESFLARCWASIAPLRFGAGMKGKVGEALAAGVPVVTTPFGAQGLGAVNGHSIMIADGPKEFAECVLRLITDASLRREIGQCGRKLIEQRFSVAAVSGHIPALVHCIEEAPIRESVRWLPVWRGMDAMKVGYEKHLAWRFHRAR